MSAPEYLASDYLSALQALMPTGRVWPKEFDAIQTSVLTAFSQEYQRSNLSANDLLLDAFPATTYQLLPEWESSLGLPDPCVMASPTIQARRNQVVARLTATGGQSIAYFIQHAANLGYAITIRQYTPFRLGQHRMGHQLGSQDWAFRWDVIAPLNTLVSFRTGVSTMGEPLESWGNSVLECELQEIAPAHTVLKFSYQ